MGLRIPRPVREALVVLAVIAVPAGVYLAWEASGETSASDVRSSTVAPFPSLRGDDFRRRTIYDSPQDPGYTSWVGAWIAPDGSMMTAFTQATGPVDPSRRTLVPERVLAAFGVEEWDPNFDFWGLDLRVKYLRSGDDGATWQETRSDPYQALYPHALNPQPTLALDDGTLLRRVNGDDLRQDATVPHTAFLQRLEPGEAEWSEPQLLMDPSKFTYQISRMRYLSDGRLVATGNSWEVPADTPPGERKDVPSTYLLMVSSDDGKTWTNGLTIPSEVGYLDGNEWDTAELANGDLLAVMRTSATPEEKEDVRKQALLRKEGDAWVLTDLKAAPFPHSGHPELLATREGVVLHIATSGVHYTVDGSRWKPLSFPSEQEYGSKYYPRAVQTKDGVVHVFGHSGGDDDYGERDQEIVLDSFRLR